ncbi:hypothetical protein SK128_028168 [Halocaridina rubra]|uniref:Carboxylesterase type B domain-containing protein n=1 Tax=Halocaridina rubra TaxID=373956 RepID=A0AAN8XNE1_HALRR
MDYTNNFIVVLCDLCEQALQHKSGLELVILVRIIGFILLCKKSQGTVHGEELPYIFGAPLVGGFNHFGLNYTLEEVFLSELVMTQWTNFAKTGDPNFPTPQNYSTPGADYNWNENLRTLWPPYEKLIQKYLHIDMQVVSKDHYRSREMALWNRLIPDLISTRPVVTDPGVNIPRIPPTAINLVPTMRPSMPIPYPDYPITHKIPHTTAKPKPYFPSSKPRYPLEPYPIENLDTSTPAPSPTPPTYAGTPISIVIVVGIVILFINCCAMGGVYYQRDKIKQQSALLKRAFFSRKSEDSDEGVSDAPSSSAMKERKHRKKESKSDYEVSDEIHSESGSRTSAVSRDSSLRRKQSQTAQDSSSKQETPKSSLKSKGSKPGHKRHRSENHSIYSEIGRTAEVHVHADASGSTKIDHRKNQTVKFNTISGGLPPKSVTKSTTSISSKASIRSNTSRASVKSTTSRTSVKSTTSEKRLKKNASCQSLPTAEYSWGITPEMTMTERDDPDGHDDQRTPADRQQTLAAMQKLKYPKVLPDHPDGVHAATLPKMRPPPPPRSTSLTAKDIQELEENIHVVYRKKRPPQRDMSTDSCDLSGAENIYGMGSNSVPTTSMYGAPSSIATVSRARSRKSDGAADYGRTMPVTDYVRSAKSADYGLQGGVSDYGRAVGSNPYGQQGVATTYSGYIPYESSYGYKAGSAPSTPRTPTTPTKGDEAKTFTYTTGMRSPRGPLATFGKSVTPAVTDGPQHESVSSQITNNSSTSSAPAPSTSAVVTAAAQTALATVTAPAFVGATSPGKSTPRTAPPPASFHSSAIQQDSASSSDATTVYEQSENTGTIKRKKTAKRENPVKTVVIQEPFEKPFDKPFDKPLKGVLKQTSAYDKPKPVMAKAPGASPSASASSLSSATSADVGTVASGSCDIGVGHEVQQKTSSLKKSIIRPGTPGARHKTRQENHTSHSETPE